MVDMVFPAWRAKLAVAIWLRNLYEWVETQLVRIP
jgi:hypothetical protein